MSIPEAIQAHLTALGVPVLLPSEMETPNKGAGKGQKAGMAGYVERDAPTGFIQIGRAVPMGRGLIGRYWYPITTVSPTLARTAELSELVFTRLCGDPVRAPGQFRPQFHAPPEEAPPGLWSSTLTVEAAQLGGALI